MRKVIIVLAAVAIVALGVLTKNMMSAETEKPKSKSMDKVTTVFTQKVELTEVPVYVESTGVLEALEKVELYSEVQGLMLADGGKFKEGRTFRSGDILVAVKSDEVLAQLVALRSSFQRLLTSVMADLRLDYAAEFENWNSYLKELEVNQSLKPLPKVSSEQLKLFLTGRSIYSEFYNIKNAEINLAKYSIRAPFSGVLTEANVDPGTVIRPGQKLGVYIRPNVYELEVAVSSELAGKLQKGQKAKLSINQDFSSAIEGTISRINRTVNTESQMSSIFIKTSGENLRDGMFMHANIQAESEPKALEISRSMLFNDNQVFIVKDSILMEKTIEIKHVSKNTAVISGLMEGEQLMTKIPPGAFAGMKVSIYQETESK